MCFPFLFFFSSEIIPGVCNVPNSARIYSAERLARGLRPKNGETQRGDTTGKMMQNEDCDLL